MSRAALLRRLIAMLPTLLGATLIAFVLGVVAPGDPAVEALSQGPADMPAPEEVAALRAEWGLDQPLPVQYVRWLGRVLRGDLGRSYFDDQPISEELARRLPATILLACAATLLAVLAGVGAGIVAALDQGGWLDEMLRVGSVVVASIPGFLTGLLLIAFLAEPIPFIPTSGYGRPIHLLLPVIALSVGEAARLLRLTRTQLIEILQQDFARTARAKGLTGRLVTLRHALPNVLLNIATAGGLFLGAILGGSAIIETVFAWPGIGSLAVQAITRRDYPMVQGFVLFSAAIYIGVNLLVDLSYSLIDPRARIEN